MTGFVFAMLLNVIYHVARPSAVANMPQVL
jgi:hypothetical protein